jgi:hypothetical protein
MVYGVEPMVWGVRFRIGGSWFTGSGFRVQGLWSRAHVSWCMVRGLGFQV